MIGPGRKHFLDVADVAAAARAEHLLCMGAGDNVVRLLPPLNVTDGEIEEAMVRLDRAAASLEKNGAGS